VKEDAGDKVKHAKPLNSERKTWKTFRTYMSTLDF